MKRVVISFLTFCALAVCAQDNDGVVMQGNPCEIGGLKYRLIEDCHEAIVDNMNSWQGELDIPSEIIFEGHTYTVTSIAWHAFSNCQTLTKVRIPKTMREVFTVSVDPDSNKNPFVGCTCLESIEVAEDNPTFCSIEGVLYDKEMTMLCSYPLGAKQQSYTVPEGVTRIGGDAFSHSPFLVTIQIPSTVEVIDHSAFSGCEHLETVNLPDGISHLAAYMFKDCACLKDIEIPNGIKTLAEQVFLGCTSLRKIDVPATVYYIGSLAFRGCTLNDLIIRGHISEYLTKDIFSGLNESAILYVPASEVDRYKSVFSGTVLPLESYNTAIFTPLHTTVSLFSNDLQGRRVSRPARGIYIREGKKTVVR